jgi:hypothetical protein
MPMNPRLLRPTEGGFRSPDADARAYLAAVRQADGANLEPAVAKAISDFVIGCKTDGIWNAIKASCILAGARTLAGALTPLKGGSPTNTNNNFVSGDYDRKTGLIGDAATKQLDTNRNNNADPQDDQHVAVYVSSITSGLGHSYFSTPLRNTAGSTSLFRGSLQSNWGSRRSVTASVLAVNNANMVGFAGVSRFQSADFEYRANGATVTSSSFPSGTPENANVFIFSAGGANYANCRLAWYSVGESLNLSQLDARLASLIAAIGAAI